jgi:Spy/CpxP family protein refolding chaperone
MKHYLRTLALIFSVALNLAFVGSYAYRTLTKRPAYVYEEIRLDAAQRARMISSRNQFLATMNPISNRIIELQVKLIDGIAAEPADRSAIDATLAQISSEQQSMQRTVIAHVMEDKNILDPSQRKQYFDLLKQRIRSQSLPQPPWLPHDRNLPGATGR